MLCFDLGGEDFQQPEEQKRVVAEEGDFKIGCITTRRRLFNRKLAGPTWRINYSGLDNDVNIVSCMP